MASIHYTKDHEYIRIDGENAAVGISAYAQEQLGDVVFVELPVKGKTLAAGEQAAVVESVKAASEVFMPLAGEIIEVNSALEGEPGTVNADPEGAGWFFKIKLANAADAATLMDEAAYEGFLKTLA